MKTSIGTTTRLLLLLAAGLAPGWPVVSAVTVQAQSIEPFRWQGRLAAGRVLEIKGVSGDIRAVAASADTIEVVADRRGHRNDPLAVRIDVVEHAGGVTVCAVYPSDDSSNECRPGPDGRMNVRNNDVKVDFAVRVPAGVQFIARTVNGDVVIEEVSGNAEAYTVNGSVRVASRGVAQAETVNGSITASLGRADWSAAREFRTVNGSITLDLPDEVSARIHAKTLNGSLDTDFPITVSGRVSRQRLQGAIGAEGSAASGRELVLETVNGDIHLRRLRK